MLTQGLAIATSIVGALAALVAFVRYDNDRVLRVLTASMAQVRAECAQALAEHADGCPVRRMDFSPSGRIVVPHI